MGEADPPDDDAAARQRRAAALRQRIRQLKAGAAPAAPAPEAPVQFVHRRMRELGGAPPRPRKKR